MSTRSKVDRNKNGRNALNCEEIGQDLSCFLCNFFMCHIKSFTTYETFNRLLEIS